VPDKLIIVGLVAALLTILILPVATPVTGGAKEIPIEHEPVGAMLVPQVLVELNIAEFAPEIVTVPIVKGAVPEFVTKTVCTTLVVLIN